MSLIRINHDPPRWHLVMFGVIWTVLFGALTWRLHALGSPPIVCYLLAGVAFLLPAPGWFFSPWMRALYVGSIYATMPIGWVVSHVIIAFIYFAVLMPIGLMLRLRGYDPLQLRGKKKESYWVQREGTRKVEQYFRQF